MYYIVVKIFLLGLEIGNYCLLSLMNHIFDLFFYTGNSMNLDEASDRKKYDLQQNVKLKLKIKVMTI